MLGQRAGLLPSACPQRAGLIPGLWKVKIIIPTHPVGGGAVDTNDWCINDTYIVRPANRDWACQTERCHTLSNKTSLQ